MNPNPNPLLVEPTIKSIMNSQLNDCKKDKFLRNSMFLNIFLFIIFSVVVSVILFIQYKGKQNIEEQIIKKEIIYYLNYKFFKK